MIQFLKKNAVFFFVLLFLVLKYSINEVLGINEQVILPIAKHFMDPSWIPNDWYLELNSDTSYRLFFNVFAGGLSMVMPLEWVSVVGRVISFTFFAYFMQVFANLFQVKAIFLIPILFLFSNNQSLEAGEWIFRGFETKPFAYTCSFLALLFLIRRKYVQMLLFAGLSVSFHMLIGFFGGVSLILAFILNFRDYKDDLTIILKKSWIALVSGAFGIYVVINYFLSSSTADSKLASDIYFLFRTPHHNNPGAWDGYKYMVLLVVGILFFAFVYKTAIKRQLRIWAAYGLASSTFFIAGLAFYYSGYTNFLKFYWFRFSDTVVPFFFLMILVIAINHLYNSRSYPFRFPAKWQHFSIPEPIAITLRRVFFLATAILFVFLGKDFVPQYEALKTSVDASYIDDSNMDLNKSMLWINENTDKSDRFLVTPYARNFYMIAERGMFVSLKHFVQKDEHIIEWFERMKICNNDQPLEMTSVFDMKNEIERNFNAIPLEKLKQIHDAYHLEYYLCSSKRNLNLPVVYENGAYKLYKIAD